MKTIRSILKETVKNCILANKAGELSTTHSGTKSAINAFEWAIDQALAEIEEVMNECKPKEMSEEDFRIALDVNQSDWSFGHARGYKKAIDQYQSNLHKALGKE